MQIKAAQEGFAISSLLRNFIKLNEIFMAVSLWRFSGGILGAQWT